MTRTTKFYEILGEYNLGGEYVRNSKLRNSIALLGMTMLFLSLFCIVGVEAQIITPGTLDHKTPVTFEFTNDPGTEFDKLWFTGKPMPETGFPDGIILHSRGYDHFGEVTGDLVGTLFYDGDVNLNMITLDGAGGGTAIFTVDYGALSGTFEGRMTIKVRTGLVTGTYMGHGDGDFDGMHLRFKFTGALGQPGLANGVIISP
jgi:hypothetical protein